MALEFLRHNPVSGYEPNADIGQKKSTKKFSKRKFSILLSGNVIIWLIFAVSFFELPVFSMPSLPTFSKPEKLAVTGIVFNKKLPLAIISNSVYREGEEVDGYSIIEITRQGVKLQKGDEIIFRELHKDGNN